MTIDEMNGKALRAFAAEHNIDVSGVHKKKDLIKVIQEQLSSVDYNNENNEINNEEGIQMNEQEIMNKEVLTEEMENNTEVGNEVPATPAKKIWYNTAGEEVSMSEFIREKFTVDNMGRKEISEKFDINYRTVYGATMNMENEAEAASRGRSAGTSKIKVTADNKVYSVVKETIDGVETEKHMLDGEELLPNDMDVIEIPETTEVDRNTWIKERVAAGDNRGDIAKKLNVSYGVVYGLTKDAEGGRTKHEVEIEDPENPGQTKVISRNEYIRMKVAEGMSKSDVAKELGVEYSVVWQATKKEKTTDEKIADHIDGLVKLADLMEDAEGFKAYVEAIKAFAVKAVEENTEA